MSEGGDKGGRCPLILPNLDVSESWLRPSICIQSVIVHVSNISFTYGSPCNRTLYPFSPLSPPMLYLIMILTSSLFPNCLLRIATKPLHVPCIYQWLVNLFPMALFLFSQQRVYIVCQYFPYLTVCNCLFLTTFPTSVVQLK